MPKIRSCPETGPRATLSSHQPLAIRKMENSLDRPTSNCSSTSQIRYCSNQLLHQVGGGRATIHDHRGQMHELHLKKHYMLVWCPHSIIIENEKQFDKTCQELGIYKLFSTPGHPQMNGQVEAANKMIKDNLKKKLERLKGAWVDELPMVLWAYSTTPKEATGETPVSLVFGNEVVILTEVGPLS